MEKINNNTYININSIQSLQIINDKYYAILTSGSKMEITKDQFDKLSVSHGIPGEIVNKNTIGNLTDLTTTDKSNVVSAINELNNKKYEFVYTPINEEITKVEEIITYLNNQNINISDYLGKIIIFETNTASIDNDKWNFIIIPTNYDLEGVLICSNGIYRIYFSSGGYYVSQYAQVLDIKDLVGELNNLTTSSKNNLVGAINEVNKNTNKNNLELTDLKEALYGYVFGPEPTPVEIESTIPTTTTINDTTYNLVDNVRGLIESINGNTVKSENLLVLEDVEETTINGVTYSIKNGVITLNGTASDSFSLNLLPYFTQLENIYYKFFNISGTSTKSSILAVNRTYGNPSDMQGTISNLTEFRIYTDSGFEFNNYKFSLMVINGTTAPTEFKQGFNGLKSVEYEGLKIKGANLINIQDIAETTINGITYSVNNGIVKAGGTAIANTRLLLKLSSPISASNYSYNQFVKLNGYNVYLSSDNAISNIQLLLASYNTNGVVSNITTTFEANYLYFYIPNGASFDTHSFTPMLIKGTTAPSEFKSYNSNAFNTLLPFNTTLRGAGTGKDKIVITKNSDNDYYTATKVVNCGEFDLGTFSYSITTSGLFESNNLMGIAKGPQTSLIKGNILCSIYSVINSNSITGPSGTNPSPNMVMAIAVDGKLYFNNLSYTNASDFKNAMSGVMLVYELATPTTEILSTTLTESEVMTILELGGSVDIINSNSEYVNGSTTIEMVYKLINS